MTSTGIMPWIGCAGVTLAMGALLAGCSFHGDYAGGHYRCSDGICPSGLVCIAKECVVPADAGAGSDAHADARMPALTCADPGLFPAGGGTTSGATAPSRNTIDGMCGGTVLNGDDAVYRVTTTAGDHVRVSISGSGFPAAAYVIAPCQPSPNVPACEGNMLATASTPIDVTPASTGAHYVVVDAVNPTDHGTYTLTVSVGP